MNVLLSVNALLSVNVLLSTNVLLSVNLSANGFFSWPLGNYVTSFSIVPLGGAVCMVT